MLNPTLTALILYFYISFSCATILTMIYFIPQSKQPIAVLLCEQNARAIHHVTTARHNIQTDMVNFTDKLFTALAANCTCCAARGFSDCPLQFVNDSATPKAHTVQPEHSHPSSSNNMSNFNTPVSDKIQGVRLQLSDDEGVLLQQPTHFFVTNRTQNGSRYLLGLLIHFHFLQRAPHRDREC